MATRRLLALALEPWCFSSHQEQAVDQCYGIWRCKLIDLRLHAVSLFFKILGYLLRSCPCCFADQAFANRLQVSSEQAYREPYLGLSRALLFSIVEETIRFARLSAKRGWLINSKPANTSG